MQRSFLAAADLAGFFTAHAVWSASASNPTAPVLGFERAGERSVIRYTGDGTRWLDENPDGVERAVFIVDATITLDGRETDALVIDARQYGEAVQRLEAVLPYRPCDHPEGFRVYKPRFIAMDGIEDEARIVGEAFFRGVDSHTQGAKVWSDHVDQSL